MNRRSPWRPAVAALALAAAGCESPRVGPAAGQAQAASPRIVLSSASVGPGDRVEVSFQVTEGGAGASAARLAELRPTWTLAFLGTDPVSSLPAWQSHLLTGAQTMAQLPIAGPGTPAPWVLANARQPGTETGGALADLGGGGFRYTFANALPPGWDPAATHRVGVWLAGTAGTAETAATLDFVPAGGPPQVRDTVLDANCNRCHGLLRAHGGYRSGVRLCLTCHTFQNADPDTADPAAMSGATAATNPNPLDLGRLVHRIHRGRNLPTLYASSSTAPAPPLPSASALPLPFSPDRNAPAAGRKFSVVGYRSREFVFGRILSRTDNGQPAKLVAAGVAYPRDLRHCDACHGGAAQGGEQVTAISRRTCQGCHPDVWFGAGGTDAWHFAHAGGPQADDAQCAGCHVATTPAQPKLYAPIADLHVAPQDSPSFSPLAASIASVAGMRPGEAPTVAFTLSDRNGPVSPLGAPAPPGDAASPVPRALERVALTVSGPTAPDYQASAGPAGLLAAPLTEVVPLTAAADASGRFSHTFASALPAGATGTWAVSLEARRRKSPTVHYDVAADAFPWPGTGEAVTEYANNPVAYVDVSAGATGAGAPVARRRVVAQERCEACHQRLSLHGGLRHEVEYCVMCHTPERTDWERRPKGASGDVDLLATYDGIEERSVHFKVLVHRIHTGARAGSAELSGIEPFAVYGFTGVRFFDEVEFPNDLRNCALCHEGPTFTIESVPAGAAPTRANESPTLLHAGTVAHGAAEQGTPPVQAACLGCHATGPARLHAAGHTASGVEQCRTCHGGTGSLSVYGVHGVAPPAR